MSETHARLNGSGRRQVNLENRNSMFLHVEAGFATLYETQFHLGNIAFHGDLVFSARDPTTAQSPITRLEPPPQDRAFGATAQIVSADKMVFPQLNTTSVSRPSIVPVTRSRSAGATQRRNQPHSFRSRPGAEQEAS